jgi:hypothetical protein
MKGLINLNIVAVASLATVLLIGCADAHHVKETTTTREYDTPVQPLSNPSPSGATTTTVTQDNDGAVVQRRTTTTYSDPR